VITFQDVTSSIRKRLLFSFIGLVSLVLVPTLILLVISYNIQARYQQTLENITREYQVTETFDRFASSYTQLLQDINNEQLTAQYEGHIKELGSIFSMLEKTVLYDESRALLTKLEGTTGFVREYTNRGLKDIRGGDFSQSSETLEQVNRGKTSIRENTANLILMEIQLSKEEQERMQRIATITLIVGIALLFMVVSGSIILALTLSNRISAPLIKLSRLASDIAKGNLGINVEENFLKMKDEIGSLSNSFHQMVNRLREMINELQSSKSEVEKINQEVTQKASELERVNKLMIGRELKMIELKKEIETLNKKLNTPK